MKKVVFVFLLSTFLSKGQTFCYTTSSPAWAPDPYNAGTNLGLLADDAFSGVINLPFPFCYDGVVYNQCLISTNGTISFNIGQAGGYNAWSIPGPIPAALPATNLNSILGVWEDLDFAVTGTIYYQTLGVAPNRRFVVAMDNAAYYSCNADKYKGQIVLYETTYDIAILAENQVTCLTWQGGVSIEGLNNAAGTVAVPIAGRNDVSWTITNDTKKFTKCGAVCVVLPIELIQFNGVNKNNYNQLTWSTASEKNNAYFSIERSSDGINFTEINRVNGAGNSNTEIDYSYNDYISLPGISYYRLQFVDNDGQKNPSVIVAVFNSSINKTLIRTLNIMGEQVDSNYSGIVLQYYSDGSVVKKLQN